MLIQEPVHATIWHCLNHYDYKDATFLAELLYSEVHSDESLHLLATCYYRSGKIGQAYDLLQANGNRTPQCKFLMAKCCHELNRLAEAEAVLTGDDHSMPFSTSSNALIEKVASEFGDASAFALQILSRIYTSTERAAKGVEVDKAVLHINPFLWSSFEASCNSDCSDIDPFKLLDVDHLKTFSHCFGVSPILSYANNAPNAGTMFNVPQTQHQNPSNNQFQIGHINQNVRHGSSTSTPILPPANIPSTIASTALTDHVNKGQGQTRQQQQVPIKLNQPTTNDTNQQLNLMTTMITPVNQMLFETTHGTSTGAAGNDSCFTGSPMSEKSEITGVGQLNFSMDSDTGNTPIVGTGNKESSIQQQSYNQSGLPNVSNTVPAVTVTPSTPLFYTPSPATNLVQSGSATQRCGAMPPPVIRPKPKKTFSHVISSNTSGTTALTSNSHSPQPLSMFSKKLNLMSVMKGEIRNNGNSSFGFLPKGQLKWSANLSYNANENSPLPPLSLELSPALDTRAPHQTEITLTPINLQSSSDGTNLDSSPYAILTPLNQSPAISDVSYTNISSAKDGLSVVINTTTTNADQKATNKRASLQTHSLNTNISQTTGILNSQNITPVSQISHVNVVGNDRINSTAVTVGGSATNHQSPRRSGRLSSDRNLQPSPKSSKENTVSRPVSMLLSPNIGGGLSSSIDRGPSSEGRGLMNTDRVKPTSRNIKSPSRNKSNPSNKNTNRLAEKNEKNRQQGRIQVEKEPEDKDKQNSPIGTNDLATCQKTCVQKGSVTAALSPAEFKEQQRRLVEQAFIIQKASVEGLMELMRVLGYAYLELTRYNNRNAIKILQEEISFQHRNSSWVQGLLGKAHFELAEYKEAVRFFNNMRTKDPHRLVLTEYFSTALWHLQEEVELSVLAQELTRIDKYSPQAWCAAGNCFSIQKEHENAIKFFQRAVQVDPNFAYAYTLLGHEYVSIEELDKALSCYRSAVRVDPRHYNAWYGIGLTYYKQERYQLAEIYYRKALAINPQSPILIYHVAVVQHALQKSDKALETLNSAIKLAPKNPIGKFERASILFSLERYNEALEELNLLKQLVPKESSVFFLIGKVHSKLGNTHLALMHISWAMDLDPKGANSQIKDALDPTLNRAGQEDASSVAPSAVVPSTSTSMTAAGSVGNNSQLINITQSTAFHAEESNIDQSSLITDEAGPSSMHQNSLDIDVSNEIAISRSIGANNILEDEDSLDISVQPNISNVGSQRIETQLLDNRGTSSNVITFATEEDISSPDDLSRTSGTSNPRRELRLHRHHATPDTMDVRGDDDRTETQAATDFTMEDLPPLRDTPTSSLQFYQQREENVLLAPELMTSSPTSRTPANIRTNTTGTSPTRPFDHTSNPFDQTHNPFSQVNQREEIFSDSRSNTEVMATTTGFHISDNHDNLNMNQEGTSHSVNERTSNINRAMGSDESL